MSIITVLARPLLAVPFITSGVDAIRNTPEHVEAARQLEGTPVDNLSDGQLALATKVLGGVRVAAGAAMAFGKKSRRAALVLALTEVPLAIARNPVHQLEGEERSEALAGLASSLGLVGGAFIAAGDRKGKPSLAWRLENRRDHKDELAELAEDYKAQLGSQKEKYQEKIAKIKAKN